MRGRDGARATVKPRRPPASPARPGLGELGGDTSRRPRRNGHGGHSGSDAVDAVPDGGGAAAAARPAASFAGPQAVRRPGGAALPSRTAVRQRDTVLVLRSDATGPAPSVAAVVPAPPRHSGGREPAPRVGREQATHPCGVQGEVPVAPVLLLLRHAGDIPPEPPAVAWVPAPWPICRKGIRWRHESRPSLQAVPRGRRTRGEGLARQVGETTLGFERAGLRLEY